MDDNAASTTHSARSPATTVHLPSLMVAVAIMLGGTAWPWLMVRAGGARADHGLTLLLLWAMSAGFVRGVGFVPGRLVWRWLFSARACALALLAAACLRGGLIFG
jgi:predicted membrane protein